VRKSAKVALSILATVAVGACSDNGTQSAETRECVDRSTNAVVSKDWCTPGHPHYTPVYAWYYGGSAFRADNGLHMRGGSFSAPRASSSRAFGRSSPTVSRGVIGGHSSAHAGG
jgi:hypothetical protein